MTLLRHDQKRVPASARTAALATAGLWAVAVLLFTGQAQGDVAVSDSDAQIIVYWLLAVGTTTFWCAFMRVSHQLVDADWHIAYQLDPGAIVTAARDRNLDRILAHGLGADRPPDFWPTGTWRLFAKIGAVFWVISALVTIDLATRWWPVAWPHRGMLLLIFMSPAVQCTAAGVIGPGLTRMLELREAAREARRLLCEQTALSPATDAAARPAAAQEDLRETMTIHVGPLRDANAGAKGRPLRVVKDTAAPHPGRPS